MSTKIYSRLIAAIHLVAAMQAATWAQIPAIQLSALSRSVGQVASTFPVRVSEGEQLEAVDKLVFTHPGISATLLTGPARLLETEPQPLYGQFNVTVAPEVTPGLYEVRAHGRFGLSSPRPFLVTQSPVQHVEQEHTKAETAIDLSLQQIMVDRVHPQRKNFYNVTLTENDVIQICGHARRLDSRAVVTLSLIDPKGREVGRSRAMGEFPAEIVHQAKLSGNYTLLAYDFLYQGGESYAIALQAVVGPNASAPATTELKQLCSTAFTMRAVSSSAATGQFKPFAAAPGAFFAQGLNASSFPSDAAATAERGVPFTEAGAFGINQSRAQFDFKAQAGQSIWIDVQSANLDQLTDPRLIVYKVNRDANGKETLAQLAEQDDAPTLGTGALKARIQDPYVNFTASEEGIYRALLVDNESGARPTESARFLLSARTAQPTFELLVYQPFPSKDLAQAKNWASNLQRGGTEYLHVIVARRDGFNDPIELSIEGLPTGVSCAKALIAPGASEGTLILHAAEDAPESIATIKVIGRSTGQVPIQKQAVAATIARGATPIRNAVETRLCTDLTLCVNAQDTAPVTATLGDGNVLEMSRGGKLPLGIKLVRRQGGAGKCTLRPQSLPPKSTLAEVGIEGDKSEGNGELVIAPDAPVGEYGFWMLNETVIKWRPNPQSLAAGEAYQAKLKAASEDPAQAANKAAIDAALKAETERIEQLKKNTAERDVTAYFASTPVRIRIVEAPVRITSPLTLNAPVGTQQSLELKLERRFGFADAVDFSLQGKSPVEGLEVPNVQVAAGTDAGTLVVKIPAGAVASTVNLPIKMDCKFNGHAISQTLNVTLNIVPPQ